jgi:hypothetical protein
MDEQTDANEVKPAAPNEVGSDARELIRDWEVLFWAFLLFGVAVSLPAGEQRLSLGPLLRICVLRRPGVSHALGV